MSSSISRALLRRATHLLLVTLPAFGGRGVQFLALAAMALLVSPADYGRFTTLQVLVLGLASIAGSTMGASANTIAARAARAGTRDVRQILAGLLVGRRRALVVNALVSVVAVPVGYAVVVGPTTTTNTVVLAGFGLLSAVLPIGETVVAVLAGTGRYRTASWTDAVRAVVGAGLALLLGVTAGPWWAVVGMLSVDGVMAGVAVVVTLATVRGAAALEPLHDPRAGLLAGFGANVMGQVTNWIVLWAIGVVGGAAGLGVYGLALRFSSIVTLAPQYFGKTVIGQLAAPDPSKNHWTPRSFVAVLGALSFAGSAASLGLLVVVFPALVHRYDGLVVMLSAVLVATSLRAVLIGLGHVCVAKGHWRTWVVADATSLVVTVVGVLLVLSAPTGAAAVTLVVVVTAAANAAGITTRFVGLSRPGAGRPEVAR